MLPHEHIFLEASRTFKEARVLRHLHVSLNNSPSSVYSSCISDALKKKKMYSISGFSRYRISTSRGEGYVKEVCSLRIIGGLRPEEPSATPAGGAVDVAVIDEGRGNSCHSQRIL